MVSQQRAEPASEPELAKCQQAVSAEVELLAENLLDGYDVTVIDNHVTIYLPNGEVLADGEFLGGTGCFEILRDSRGE